MRPVVPPTVGDVPHAPDPARGSPRVGRTVVVQVKAKTVLNGCLVSHVNPLVTLLAILFLAELMGVPGTVLAVALAAAAQIVLRELLALRSQRASERVA